MSDPTLVCQDETRRELVRDAGFNGIDYVEYDRHEMLLTVYFLGKAPKGITADHVVIKGGQRVRNVGVEWIKLDRCKDPEVDDCMTVKVDKEGDFSTYRLCVVRLDRDCKPTDQPYRLFDPRYACAGFSFKADCPRDLDCKMVPICPPESRDEPSIDYLAKDYASFRRLMLDRLALIMPEWRERHVPDVGIALVELLAYVGDHMSYHQDAVATEAYLDTARQRISVRRHARLVDYTMHEGCNARAWVHIHTDSDIADGTLTSDNVYFTTRLDDHRHRDGQVLVQEDLRQVPHSKYEVFEAVELSAGEPINLYAAHNDIRIYTWGDRDCCLSRGATRAALYDGHARLVTLHRRKRRKRKKGRKPAKGTHRDDGGSATKQVWRVERDLHLEAGDVIIFEEVIGPGTGERSDADPSHRHPVRLTHVSRDIDPVTHQPILVVCWSQEDALPFPLCISTIGRAPACELLEDVTVVRGNVILVDHGRRVTDEELDSVPLHDTAETCESEGWPAEIAYLPGKFNPKLAWVPLTFSQPLPDIASAARSILQDPRLALPAVDLTSTQDEDGVDDSEVWRARRDLLASGSCDRHFVAEIDNEERAWLRFGDGELGRRPEFGERFTATYRIGRGPGGNVGAESIAHLVSRAGPIDGVRLLPRNPLAARGGTAPEPVDDVRLYAPSAFRQDLQRAITAEDYAQLAEKHASVQRAAATLRWTGSWVEALVVIDPIDTVDADAELLGAIRSHLFPYRRIGHDLIVAPARYVPLDIALEVCVHADFLRGHVRAALLETFSNRLLHGGRRGFFHPDELSLGEGIRLSHLAAEAQAVPGVESVVIARLRRLHMPDNGAIDSGILRLGPLEVARLDNDPSFPDNGRLQLVMRGGR